MIFALTDSSISTSSILPWYLHRYNVYQHRLRLEAQRHADAPMTVTLRLTALNLHELCEWAHEACLVCVNFQ